jgi:hypothetical protein
MKFVLIRKLVIAIKELVGVQLDARGEDRLADVVGCFRRGLNCETESAARANLGFDGELSLMPLRALRRKSEVAPELATW